jgi:hypothetical protein
VSTQTNRVRAPGGATARARDRRTPDRSGEALRRELLVEAGHRCTIPTCRQVPVRIHHINDGADEPGNLIVLCSGCGERVTRGYITRRSLEQYRANLAVINARYGELERRALQSFADGEGRHSVLVPAEMEMLMSFLVNDGMVERGTPETGSTAFHEYRLTALGKKLITRWAKAQPLD